MTQHHSDRVLVTGGTGFLAQHVLLCLARQGFLLRTSVRNLGKSERLRTLFERQGIPAQSLEFACCDLTDDRGWNEAVADCRFVVHCASPVPSRAPRHEDELIIPAREGTLRVLRAATRAGVQRVVLTSSLSAVIFNRGPRRGTQYSEADWTDLTHAGPYERSKTLAERAAWDYVARTLNAPELVAINPGLILGPVLGAGHAASVDVVRRLLTGELRGRPRIGWATVDVRDVAEAHVRALLMPEARGQRFCCAGGHAWLSDLADLLHPRYAPLGYRIPRRNLPDWLVRLASLFDASTRLLVHKLGQRVDVSSQALQQTLGLTLRPLEQSLFATADSLIHHGLSA